MALHILNHPLIEHKLTLMRSKETGTKDFRQMLDEITMLMAYEITRDMPTTPVTVQTPIIAFEGRLLASRKQAIIPILRAGLGMLEGMIKVMPTAVVGHIGLYRDPETLKPVEYYCKLPPGLAECDCIIVDPMLATGYSSAAAIDIVKRKGAVNIKLMCLVAAPEGVDVVKTNHPDVEIYTAALDKCLNEHGYIVPGLGDAGDRIFGTK